MLRNPGAAPPLPDECLPGRSSTMQVPATHYVNGNPLSGPL